MKLELHQRKAETMQQNAVEPAGYYVRENRKAARFNQVRVFRFQTKQLCTIFIEHNLNVLFEGVNGQTN